MWALVENNKKLISTSQNTDTRREIFDVSDNVIPVSLIYSVLILVPLCLFTFRFTDNNRLLSWSWSISWPQILLLLGVLSCVLLIIKVASQGLSQHLSEQKGVYMLPMLALAAAIPFWQQPEIIIDNSRYFSQAKFLELYGVAYFLQEWGNSLFVWTDLPLIPLLYGLVFQVVGEQRAAIQLINSLFFSGTLLTTYLLGKNLWGHERGMLGAILLLAIPYIYNQLPLMLVDIPAMFFLSLSLLVSLLAVKHSGRRYFALAAVTIVLAMLTKYSIWLMLSVIPMLLFISNKKFGLETKIILSRLMAIAAGVLFLSAIIVFMKYDVIRQQLSFLFSYQWSGLARWQESNVSSFFFHIHPLVSLLALAAVVMAFKKRDYRFLVIAWLPLLVVMLEVKRMRYLIPVLPMIALMAAYALAELKNSCHKIFVAYGAAGTAFLIALTMSTGFLQNTSASNIKSAGDYLNGMNIDVAEVIVLPQHRSVVNPVITIPTLDYFTGKALVYRQDQSFNSKQIPEHVYTSSVRFTWEYTLPSYYFQTDSSEHIDKALVVVFSDQKQLETEKLQQLLKHYRIAKSFDQTTGVFKYQTFLNIYEPI